MSRSPDYLYKLLPYIHRLRDSEQGEPLRALLNVINEQVNVVEDDIAALYDNWFIETCEDWVVPYIGDLVGYRPVNEPGADTNDNASQRNKVIVPRREVANTINFRRRKGTIALLELLANDVANWPARAVEFYQLLGVAQHLKYQRLSRGRTADLRHGDVLDLLNGPFDSSAHAVDVRRINSHRTPGCYNIPSVGVFVWRLRSYSVTDTPVCCVEKEGSQCYTFSVLGNDTPLFTRPERESAPTDIATEINLPIPIRARAFATRVSNHPFENVASAQYYGIGKSLSISVQDWPSRGIKGVIPQQNVIPVDLSDWHRYKAKKNQVLVDPVRGRALFPASQLPKSVTVRYQYGFSADMGGGEYWRALSAPQGASMYRVRKVNAGANEFSTVQDAYKKWRTDQAAAVASPNPIKSAVIEIADSSLYEERFTVVLALGESLQIRAANRTRPVIRLLDYRTDQPDPFSVSGSAGSRFTLDGLLITGRNIEIVGFDQPPAPGGDGVRIDTASSMINDLCDVTIRHCTLVPGWELDCACEPQRLEEPSIIMRYSHTNLKIEHSIVGPIWVIADERRNDPAKISISDSIVDATDDTGLAICDEEGQIAFADLSIARSTVIGGVIAHAAPLLENSIFMSQVRIARRQNGCVRFCHLPDGSRTPRRYHCQPDLAKQLVDELLREAAAKAKEMVDEAAIVAAKEREQNRVVPMLNSQRYGTPAYCQLANSCAEEIVRGADDESEMGAFHDLFQPQRTANLRTRLDEYTPAGMETGIIFGS